jgi:hypothetical protein
MACGTVFAIVGLREGAAQIAQHKGYALVSGGRAKLFYVMSRSILPVSSIGLLRGGASTSIQFGLFRPVEAHHYVVWPVGGGQPVRLLSGTWRVLLDVDGECTTLVAAIPPSAISHRLTMRTSTVKTLITAALHRLPNRGNSSRTPAPVNSPSRPSRCGTNAMNNT